MATRLAISLVFVAALAAGPVAVAQVPAPSIPAPDLLPPSPPPTLPENPPPGAAPPPVEAGELYLPDGSRVNLPSASKQTFRFSPRYGVYGGFTAENLGDNTRRVMYTGGLIVKAEYLVPSPPGVPPQLLEYEFAADSAVVWVKGATAGGAFGSGEIDASPGSGTEVELFLSGNVVIRSQDESVRPGGGRVVTTRTLRADQIYYDATNHRAIAMAADLELWLPGMTDAVHVFGREVQQLGRREWRAVQAGVYSSKLPSDPGVLFEASEVSLVERPTLRRNFLGLPYRSVGGQPVGAERLLTGRNARVEVLGVPVFYTPYYRADPAEPLGPLDGLGFGNDRIFGFQAYTSWDIHRLLGLRPPPGHKWRLNLDYLSDRGTAVGTEYFYADPDFFGFGGPTAGSIRLWGLSDGGVDVLGPNRGPEPPVPDRTRFRGRALWRHQQELIADREPDSGMYSGGRFAAVQGQFAWLSDKNFLEQYFKQEFDIGPNQETFLNLVGSDGPWFGSLLAQGGQRRDWITETRWLPKASGALVGRSFFDLFTYTTRADVGYAQLLPATQPPFAVLPTEQRIDTVRGDWWQELSLPVRAGPVNLVPYGVLDLTGYSRDLTGESQGRVYGAGGVRSAVTLSRVYSEASSELFNLRGLNHKVTAQANYYIARTDTPFTRLPLLDRLNDDAIDQAYRTITPQQTFFQNNAAGLALMTSPIFDPQRYAIRRLVMDRVDTRDDIQSVQLELNQRWQTKRGFQGLEHTIDWLTLNLSASVFPEADRDNFGKSLAFLEYDTVWNVGDRTALASAGWFDPFDFGAHYWNVGAYFSRPDNTSLYLGYRQTDPLQSKAVTAALNYQLTKKYAVNVGAAYDFGTQKALTNTVTLTRTGTDLTVTLGVTYNALINNLGVQFAVVPNLAAGRGFGLVGPAQYGRPR